MTDPNTQHDGKADSSNIGGAANPDVVKEDSPVYQPPKGAEEADRVDADVDGTSASHYGANDPALYESDGQSDES